MNVSSRVFLTNRAISLTASSQEISSQRSEPGRRTCGLVSRRSLSMSCSSDAPFGQRVPRVIGIAFNVHHLRGGVLRLVAESVDDDATTHRTIWACAARLSRARDSERL